MLMGSGRKRIQGAALLILLAILGLIATMFVVSRLSNATTRNARNETSAASLSLARDALIASAVSNKEIIDTSSAVKTPIGSLPLPDLGPGTSISGEGTSAGNIGATDISLVGKLPWRSLSMPAVRDGSGECLWYIVSGRFKHNPPTAALNWDTPGQIDVINGQGNPIATNIAAMVVAAGPIIDGQNRSLADPAYVKCGGNYDARNYLDAYNVADAIGGQVNYFSGSTNNRQAPSTANKIFVLADNDHFNDRFLFITAEDIFRSIIKRSDFSTSIDSLMTQLIPVIQAMSTSDIAGPKGTDNLNCNALGEPDRTFCMNWKEMLFLTQLPAPSASCSRILIFAGQRVAGQVRVTAIDKDNKANYLESANLTAFDVPIAASGSFSGAAMFNSNTPGADIVRCIP